MQIYTAKPISNICSSYFHFFHRINYSRCRSNT
nr:MAG TPA: hypothetical protein [Caudoviricetes sp.]